jgi:hypothetical protein
MRNANRKGMRLIAAAVATAGAHAAHIHAGYRDSQGPVQYMLMDFTASAAATSTRRPAWPPASPPRCRRPAGT